MELVSVVQDLITQVQIAASYAFITGLLGGLAYILLPSIRLVSLGRSEDRRMDRYAAMDQEIANRIFRY